MRMTELIILAVACVLMGTGLFRAVLWVVGL